MPTYDVIVVGGPQESALARSGNYWVLLDLAATNGWDTSTTFTGLPDSATISDPSILLRQFKKPEYFVDKTFEVEMAIGGGALSGQAGTIFEAAESRAVTLEANAVRFSQSNVRSTLPRITQSMKAKGWQGSPIDVVRMADGSLTAVDNTRLAAASLSNTPVRAIIRGFDELFPAARAGGNLQGSTWGEAILNRIGSQRPAWWRLYPNGSPFTGVHASTLGFTP